MKPYFLFALLVTLVISCSDTKTTNGKDKEVQEEKENKQKTEPTTSADEENTTWTTSQKAEAMEDCMKSAKRRSDTYNEEKAQKDCSCKMEAMVATFSFDEYKELDKTSGQTDNEKLQKKIDVLKDKIVACGDEEGEKGGN